MMFFRQRKVLALIALAVLLIGSALFIVMSQTSQDARSRATAASTLYFTPESSRSSPLVANTGDTVSLDLIVNPGSNIVGIVRAVIDYDPTIFGIPDNGVFFVTNKAAFPRANQAPVLIGHKIGFSVSIGYGGEDDPIEVVTAPKKVGTLTLKVLKAPTQPSSIFFGSDTAILSIGPEAQFSENVLAATKPAYVIANTPTATLTIAPSQAVTPTTIPTNAPTTLPTVLPTISSITETPTNIPTTTIIQSPTPTLIPGTNFEIIALLHGIGSAGDNTSSISTLSNKNPLHPSRPFTLELTKVGTSQRKTIQGTLVYRPDSGTFNAIVHDDTVTPGIYYIRLLVPGFLGRILAHAYELKYGELNTMPVATLINGDVDRNYKLSVLDYSLIAQCYDEDRPATECIHTPYADINDDSRVNLFDLNLIMREILTSHGE